MWFVRNLEVLIIIMTWQSYFKFLLLLKSINSFNLMPVNTQSATNYPSNQIPKLHFQSIFKSQIV